MVQWSTAKVKKPRSMWFPLKPLLIRPEPGDAFRSGLLKGLSMGKTVVDACKLGSTCATYAVEKNGTQEHSFTMEEFTARYKTVFGPME